MKAFRFSSGISTLVTIAAMMAVSNSEASVSYSVTGSTYSQNFDSLPTTPLNASLGATPTGWTDDNASPGAGNFSILGWYLWAPIVQSEGGFNGHQRVRIGAGTSTTGSFMSWGTGSTTERALGSLASDTMAPPAGPDSMSIGLRLSNNTSDTLTEFTLTYDGEQWRNGGSGTANALRFAYSLTATTADWTNTPSFTSVSALDFTAPVVSTTAAAVDGNVAGKVAGITATITGISWAPGTDLWLRWKDASDAGADDGLGIDNLNFSAVVGVPEPSSLSLLAVGALGYVARRRKG
jgi:hypothetical protein